MTPSVFMLSPAWQRKSSNVKYSFEDLTMMRTRGDHRPMGERAAKDALYDGFAEVARALASGRRAELIDVLAQGERSVDEVAAEIGQSVANTSHHLRALARAGLVTTRRAGTRIFYAPSSERVAELWSAMRDVAADRGRPSAPGRRLPGRARRD